MSHKPSGLGTEDIGLEVEQRKPFQIMVLGNLSYHILKTETQTTSYAIQLN